MNITFMTCFILLTAHTLVNNVIKDNPRALGIVLLSHHRRVPENVDTDDLDPLGGIENGTKELKEAFTCLGLAVVRLEDPPKALMMAVIEVMSSSKTQHLPSQPPIRYPLSCRRFFFYTTGHGANRYFYMKDGSYPYYDVVHAFRNNRTFQEKYFFFDNCRSLRIEDGILQDVPELNLQQGECIICNNQL